MWTGDCLDVLRGMNWGCVNLIYLDPPFNRNADYAAPREHFQMRHFPVDHITSVSKGGTDHISNLQFLCGPCNSLKGVKSQAELLVLLTDKGWIKRQKVAWKPQVVRSYG